MYIALEYVAYSILVAILGAVLFVVSASALITREAAHRVAASSRKLTADAAQLLSRHLVARNFIRALHHTPTKPGAPPLLNPPL